MAGSHQTYLDKRNFDITSEPRDDVGKNLPRDPSGASLFVIQKHHARNLHYDFRLEMEGTLKSWAVPKGPSLDPSVKRLAVHVEDHPVSYAEFEGDIPKGQYGAGHVIVWDTGTWQPEGDPSEGYRKGKLKFSLRGKKLNGTWNLIRTRFKNSDKDHWLLIKEDDNEARDEQSYDVVEAEPDSVKDATNKRTRARKSTRTDKRKTVSASGSFPDTMTPQLATLVDREPPGRWIYEIKFDGYRLMARIKGNEVRLLSRNGHDWTDRLPEQAAALASLRLTDSWLDGEIVVLDHNNLPDFQALQNALKAGQSDDIIYFLFDAPWLNGVDMRAEPLLLRREALESVVDANPHRLLSFSQAFCGSDYESVYQSACNLALEGIIGKRPDSRYQSTRSQDWVKLKCRLRQEFIIVGYTQPNGSRRGFGALLLAVHADADSDELVYCGRVGTGFNDTQLEEIHGQLQKHRRKTSALNTVPPDAQRSEVTWLTPNQVCEVEFAQWTRDHLIRHAVFVSLREDKPAKDIVREQAASVGKSATSRPADSPATGSEKNQQKKSAKSDNKVAGVAISSGDRVIDTETSTSKMDLALFYQRIADHVLPHLKDRPVSLLRAPEGIAGEMFFQKHADRMSIPHIKQLDPDLDPGHAPLMEIDSKQALAGTVQMGAIEFHTWGSTTKTINKPDRIILDLDPDPALPWSAMIEATQLLLSVLDELELESFLKTSGGKGMHVVIPIARHMDWDNTKAFAKGISSFMARQIPERFVDKMGPKNRIKRIFIDYLRNSRGASTVAAYSVRARAGLPVSVPISRDELDDLESADQWSIHNLADRLAALKADPWGSYTNRQRISRKLWQRLGIKD